jgi:hypothetical protein
MPWRIEREGASLRVRIACPIDDWGLLFEQIERRLKEEPDVHLIDLPDRLPGASILDADILVVLRRMLDHKPGITVR